MQYSGIIVLTEMTRWALHIAMKYFTLHNY